MGQAQRSRRPTDVTLYSFIGAAFAEVNLERSGLVEWRERLIDAVGRVARMWGSNNNAVWDAAMTHSREALSVDWDSAVGAVERFQLMLAIVESFEQEVIRGPRDCAEGGSGPGPGGAS